MSRYFIHRYGATLQTPDILDDIMEGELEENIIEEVGWSWYLSCVKQNMKVEFEHQPHESRFVHAKYYGKKYMEMDRITTHFNRGRHKGLS